MREQIAHAAAEAGPGTTAPPRVRVGLHSGEVLVRSIGSDLSVSFTAVGQTTSLAARMQQLARPGTVLMTAATLDLADGYVEVKPLEPVRVRGLDAPIQVFELLGGGRVRSRLQAAAARGLTRFVGRAAEWDELMAARERAGRGEGQVIALVGEAGMGKSRLLWEFVRDAPTGGWRVLETGAVSYGRAIPYLPVIDLLKTYFEIRESESPSDVRERVTRRLLALDPALAPAVPACLALLDIPAEDRDWHVLDPQQRRARTLDALRQLLLRESQEQPLLLAFEDLHWIDAETQALLDGLVADVADARLLLLVNYRPEYQTRRGYTELRLQPLAPGSADELLETLLGRDASLRPLKHLLSERSEGNPLFLEESVRTLVETRVLEGAPGAYRLVQAVETIDIPTTVEAILAARIDRLSPGGKRLLHAAAVVGMTVPLVVLQRVTGEAEEAVRAGLAELEVGELIAETTRVPVPEYAFRHALVQEAAYRSVPEDERRALHGRIVEAIEAVYADRLGEHVEELARHALAGERWDEAVRWLRQAGGRATERSANRAAVTFFDQAVEALSHLPEDRETLEQSFDVRLQLRTALVPLGEFLRASQCCQEAEEIAERLQDPRRLGWILVLMAGILHSVGYAERAGAYGTRGFAIADQLDDTDLRLRAQGTLATVYHRLGDFRRSVDTATGVVASLAGDRMRERFRGAIPLAVWARGVLFDAYCELGRFADAQRLAEETYRVGEWIDHQPSLVMGQVMRGKVCLLRGAAGEAIPALERAQELCQRWDISLFGPTITWYLGHSLALSGRPDEAAPLLESALAEATAMRLGSLATEMTTGLGESYLLAGRIADATELGERTLALTRERKERGREGWALHLVAQAASRQEPLDAARAEHVFREAIAIADELGMRPLVARCHLGLGRLYGRIGRTDEARTELGRAATLFREMGMHGWPEQAERELKELDGS
jgi:tetratricopeptide (TPR) repeat protein